MWMQVVNVQDSVNVIGLPSCFPVTTYKYEKYVLVKQQNGT
jgi:hypothetical protein